MEVVSRRRGINSRNGAVAGSIWENRMKYDEVKGGIKVFSNSEQVENNDQSIIISTTTTTSGDNNNQVQVNKKSEMGPKPNLGVGNVISGKRKTWKSEGNAIQIARKRSELSKNLDEQCKESSVTVDGLKKTSPNQSKKVANEKELSVSLDGNERSPVKIMKAKSGLVQKQNESNGIQLRKVKSEAGNEDGNEKNFELRKIKSLSPNGNLRNSLQLVKAKSVSSKELDENCKNSDGIGKSLVESKKSNLEENKAIVAVDELRKNVEGQIQENCKEFDVCEEKVITSNVESQVKSSPKVELNLDNEDHEEELDEVLDQDFDEEFEKISVDVKEVNVAEQKSKKIVIEEKKLQISSERLMPISPIIKKQSTPISGQAKIHQPSPTKSKPVPVSDEFQRIPRQHSKLESFVDLVMWRDASKSALIFGFGTFVIISSSYTQDLNISFISVLSYLGLVYLATIFLFRSLIHRGGNDIEESSEYVVGEEEAMWVLRLILPYINECLLKIRALFSGDPATTMKMAVLLFILARCGSSITIWKMSKLGFFGVFIVPKVCSSYSTQLTAYGTFWIRRFRDAWESCTHKKAVAFAIFTLVWNLSSIAARIWAVFMMYVGFRYYQQKLIRKGWVGEETTTKEDSWQEKIGGRRQGGRRSTLVETRKQKKTI